ncbi:hypothetical protein Abci_002_097 [Acetobacter cibinongensis]|uniref:Uncharacterized protein n=1 Tax=Acetobacter cibinongensis TaxID=146475 RepID=A0A0D6N0F6_9PROT|nr:hypothetical protein Abci_002_097 [Acetobacter cibinongensis]
MLRLQELKDYYLTPSDTYHPGYKAEMRYLVAKNILDTGSYHKFLCNEVRVPDGRAILLFRDAEFRHRVIHKVAQEGKSSVRWDDAQ